MYIGVVSVFSQYMVYTCVYYCMCIYILHSRYSDKKVCYICRMSFYAYLLLYFYVICRMSFNANLILYILYILYINFMSFMSFNAQYM
jgi:hypothetical protein